MLFVSTIANVSRLPWTRHGFHLPQQQPALDKAGRWTGGGCSGEGEEHPLTGMGRDGTEMGVLREREGSRDGAGGSLCLSPPRSPEPAAPQHPSPGRVQVVAGELSSASPVAPSRRPGCCPPGRIPRQGARRGRRGNLGRGGPLVALPGSPRPPPAVGADFGVPSHPPGQPGPPAALHRKRVRMTWEISPR